MPTATLDPARTCTATNALPSATSPGGPATNESPPPRIGASLDELHARLLLDGDALDDLESVRVAASNRLKALVEDKRLPEGNKERGNAEALVKAIKAAEDLAVKGLTLTFREHPLWPWAKSRAAMGIGDKTASRFIAAAGDLVWNSAADRPRRGPAELHAYCGLHVLDDGTAPRHARGVQSNWNSKARARAYVMAETCIKQRCKQCTAASRLIPVEVVNGKEVRPWSPPPPDCTCAEEGFAYRTVYDRERVKWMDREMVETVNAKGEKQWSYSGTHKHAHAIRVTAKAIVTDMYRLMIGQSARYADFGPL